MEQILELLPVQLTNNTAVPHWKNSVAPVIIPVETNFYKEEESGRKELPFIEANTKKVDINHLRNECVIPVFSKDNEVTISHSSFIETVWEAANQFFPSERVEEPEIRVSHVIKGRTPEAIHKPVNQLLETDKTIYYERMMFSFEIPTIHEDINGNRLNLTIGGVRAYNHENLYSKKSVEKFKVFIGFKNLVCCNMCVSTDGLKAELKALSSGELMKGVRELLENYNISRHLHLMSDLPHYYLTESQFAQFLGKSRLYQCLPVEKKKLLPSFLMTDTQINIVAKSYYQDEAFGVKSGDEALSLWNMFNLLTGANKASYIDNFLDRGLNAFQVTEGLREAMNKGSGYSWFIQ